MKNKINWYYQTNNDIIKVDSLYLLEQDIGDKSIIFSGVLTSLKGHMKENNINNSFYDELLKSEYIGNLKMLYIMLTNGQK